MRCGCERARQAGSDGADVRRRVARTGLRPRNEALIAAGGAVNARAADGYTPLVAAVGWSNAAVVKVLLEHGADPNVEYAYEGTPLQRATLEGQTAIAG